MSKKLSGLLAFLLFSFANLSTLPAAAAAAWDESNFSLNYDGLSTNAGTFVTDVKTPASPSAFKVVALIMTGFEAPSSISAGAQAVQIVDPDGIRYTNDGNNSITIFAISGGTHIPLNVASVSSVVAPNFYLVSINWGAPVPAGTTFRFVLNSGALIPKAGASQRKIEVASYNDGVGSSVYSATKVFFGGGSQDSGSQGSSQQSAPPAKYAGPEFSALSSKLVTVGSSSVLEGKRLNEVSSITIGGKSATFTATSATELKLDVPKDLAPGTYDLVIQSAAGKLTHMNAVVVQAPRRSLSVTTVAEGRVTQDQFAEHALIASMQQRDLTRVRCIVNGPNLEAARAQAEQLCAAVRSANRHIETSIVEPRSTVKDNKVYSRVIFGWN